MKIYKQLFLFLALLGGCELGAQEKSDYTYLKMESSPFHVNENYLARHDIVYLSPTQ